MLRAISRVPPLLEIMLEQKHVPKNIREALEGNMEKNMWGKSNFLSDIEGFIERGSCQSPLFLTYQLPLQTILG